MLSGVEWPAAEVEIDEPLVRSLLDDQHPDLAMLELAPVEHGFDNALWRLGEELLVRLPRREIAAPILIHEQRWLPLLAPRLSLPVPAPVRTGRPSGAYPWCWSIVPWLSGIPGDRAPLLHPDETGRRLGRFLRELHLPAPPGAPANPWRGGPLESRTDTFEERVTSLRGVIDVAVVRRTWDRAVGTDRWGGPPLWLHGDLHPANILIERGTIAAVIDFGDLCAGDPAGDLAGGWMLLPSETMTTFQDAYGGVDEALAQRARRVGPALLPDVPEHRPRGASQVRSGGPVHARAVHRRQRPGVIVAPDRRSRSRRRIPIEDAGETSRRSIA